VINQVPSSSLRASRTRAAHVLAPCLLAAIATVGAAAAAEPKLRPEPATVSIPPGGAVTAMAPVALAVNKSVVLQLPSAIARVAVGSPEIADVLLLNPRDIYVLGKKIGTTNVIAWDRAGNGKVIDVAVGFDAAALEASLRQLMPEEKDLGVRAAGESVILTGAVADGYKVERAVAIAESFAGSKKVVNMMRAASPQQVLLEVKIAEVSKTVLDRLGANFLVNHAATATGSGWSVGGAFLTDSPGLASFFNPGRTASSFQVDALNKDEVVKILAEPNIMAISGQEGSFLAGGKIYIPVPQGTVGAMTITLEEKEYGIGLRFTPTVLEDGRINLRVTPEVSELNQRGVVIDAVGVGKTVLPSITTRRASTTVQLYDGQSFAIGGLIKSNVTETMSRFPGLGEIPILGALFRSSDFQRDKTELLFVVTPRLVKPLKQDYRLPTDEFVAPGRLEFQFGGRLEGSPRSQELPPY
jgi:pilus assembly protein CpaC